MQRKHGIPLLLAILTVLGCQDRVLVRIKHDKPSVNKSTTQQQLSSDTMEVGVIAFFREVQYQQGSAKLLDQIIKVMRENQRFEDFDRAMRDQGFSQVRITPGQACGFSLAYYPSGARCVRYSGRDVHMDFMVMPDDRVATVVPGWD